MHSESDRANPVDRLLFVLMSRAQLPVSRVNHLCRSLARRIDLLSIICDLRRYCRARPIVPLFEHERDSSTPVDQMRHHVDHVRDSSPSFRNDIALPSIPRQSHVSLSLVHSHTFIQPQSGDILQCSTACGLWRRLSDLLCICWLVLLTLLEVHPHFPLH